MEDTIYRALCGGHYVDGTMWKALYGGHYV